MTPTNPESIKIERNSTELEFKPTEIKRGDKKGSIYYAPDVNEANLTAILTWIGNDTIIDWIQAKLNLVSQAATDEASSKLALGTDGKPLKEGDDYVYEDKPFVTEEFVAFMRELSTRGPSKDDLEDKQAKLLTQAENLAKDKSLSPADAMLKFTHIMADISSVRQALERKSAGRGRKKKDAAPTPVAA